MLRMKTALLLLLALAVATSPAWALRCYVCSDSANCMKPQTCPASSQFCKTATTVNTLSGNLVKKECADSCVSNPSQQGQISSGSWAVHCCQGDLCNGKLYSAASVRAPFSSGTLGLAMSLGLLALMVLSL
ncbi:lymphocyte antigen 6D-like [Arvicola amphibius]|uniref:lymphocyte antigen 6D-like n=1 Tax=Arvicola amphibius TaxID=1047088 RepID=UPI0018E3F56F|nr:lymphocyte antigen 6D-like [Arvicola amphibius]